MVETISEIQDPLEAYEKEENKSKLLEAEECLDNLYQEVTELKRKKAALVKAEKFTEAQLLKEELEDLESKVKQLEEEQNFRSTFEDQAWLKCLMITQDLLENCVDNLDDDPALIGILNTIILPSIKNDQPVLRNFGMKCLGLVCLVSPEEARKHLPLFLQAAENDKEDIQFTSLTLLLDITLLYCKYWRELEQQEKNQVLTTLVAF
jgi:condensin complex subunit 3